MRTRTIKTYSELITLPTFQERFDYLKLDGTVGEVTFGWKRYLNQVYYKSSEWKKIRRDVIIRDLGCDLGVEGYDIFDSALIHHMVPLTDEDIINHSKFLTNPEYLITTVLKTHNALHYGNGDAIFPGIVERKPNDTCPWRR